MAVPERDALTRRVQANLQQAEETVAGLRQTNTRLMAASLASSAGSTLVAGVTAALGPVVGAGIPGWRAACVVAAVFGFVATLTAGLHQRLKVAERLSKGRRCVGRLRSLDAMLATGSHEWREMTAEYEDITKTHPEFI
ncbi:MAG: hypothetical protein KC425_25105 [Anaerolineales bacterium]|nr:hypothetical protein [Anaerolineales bacterium]